MRLHWPRYGWAFVAVGAAVLIRELMDPLLGMKAPYALYYAAVVLAAFTGGTGPAILAVLLGGASAAYFVLPPQHSFAIRGAEDQFGFGVFLLVSATLVFLSHLERRASFRAALAEAEQRRLRQRFETTLASIGDGVIATDIDGRITFLNRAAALLTGWDPEEARGQPVENVFRIRNEETGNAVENPALRAMREGRVAGLANHSVLLGKNGAEIPIDDSSAPIQDESGTVAGAVLVFRDVRAARAREAELKDRDRMIELARDAIIVTDEARRIRSWNTGAREIYGYSPEEAIGRTTHELLQTRAPETREQVREKLAGAGSWEGEVIQRSKEGRRLIVESRRVVLRDRVGRITGILDINRDITERKRAAEEAEGGRRTLEALMENIPEGIAIADAPDARVRMISRQGLEMTGKSATELTGLAAPEHPAAWQIRKPGRREPAEAAELPLTRAVFHGEVTADEEWELLRPDGSAVPILCNAAPIRDREGRITGGLIAWRDITQRKKLEAKLLEAAKLESLGVLAGGIAHDFNNLLTGVLGNASLLQDDLPYGSAAWGYARNIAFAAEQAARLTQQILAYAGRGRFVIERVNLSEHVRRVAALLHSLIPRNVRLVFHLEPDVPLLDADPAQMQQIVMNLVMNAAEAIGEAPGRVSITTRAEEVEGGLFAGLEVADDGCGMDAATLPKIFDPFFTTKFTGRGLGLAVVQGIVRAHKGTITVESTPGAGTKFRILLPAGATAEAEAAP
jgi:two-component system cell cycle sensor histidine kinase/response regulator CckA